MPQRPDVHAAGAVVRRKGGEVLLVHRPRYDDWAFPKGKLDRGEHRITAAVREVGEETGLRIRLGPPLAPQRYPSAGRMKTVHYWVGLVVGDDDVAGYLVNHEIDDLRWLPRDEARDLLTYPHDRDTLDEAFRLPRRSRALVVLRHATARARATWRGEDRVRPLAAAGRREADRIVPLLAAYDVGRIVSSSSTRCVETVAPYATECGWPVETLDGLTEEDATAESVAEAVDDLLAAGEAAVLCTHRPVLPAVLDALGVPAVPLEPGGMLVVHHRRGRVLASEVHGAP